ncbi:hypothetical protein [Paenibacillus turpanensis]|uniref:hypothetical protein n=1 Tax=Paenibacillus turpanensis TaxID=2689078 RepID=UPI00140E6A08|nr:hypothetical protein [Paenibacillus turpanensis]
MKWLWLSVLLHFIGLVWDEIYHQTRIVDVEYIPVPHWPMVIAPFLLVAFSYKYFKSDRPQSKPLSLLLILATVVLLVGTAWDNFGYHVRGIELPEDAPPHVTMQLGFYATLLLLIAASITGGFKQRRIRVEG